MAEVGSGEQADLNKLKVNDLRKMLKTRGLSVVGNKQELIDRLQSSEAAAEALLEGSEVGDIIDEDLDRELDETALDDEPSKDVEEHKDEKKTSEPAKDAPKTDSSSGNIVNVSDAKDTKDKLNGSSAEEKPQAPKHKRITITDITVADANSRKKARLERFNQATTESANSAETTDALAKRTARFSQDSGPPATPKVINDPLNSKKTVEVSTKPETNELLKKRAQRFGILSPAEAKKQQLEKLQARKARFASTLTSTPATEKTTAPPLPAVKTASTVDEKKRLRAERFKIKV